MLDTNFPPWPSYTSQESETASRVLLSNKVNYWTGVEGRQFEVEFAKFSDSGYSIALSNGTVALELALAALGIGPGDDVIVTPRTFFASVSCVVSVGARPVFADVDPDSQNITAESIEAVLTARSKAIVCVHLAGWPCEMDDIVSLAETHGLFVIEDCAQAHGARIYDRSVGSWGNLGTWSFCQDKIITTAGEGGMVTTNDERLWSSIWSKKDHGKSYDAVYGRQHRPGFRWLHESFGTNARMTEVQAAIGRIQLNLLPEWHRRRREIAERIWAVATNLPGLRVPKVPDHIEHAAYKCYMFVQLDRLATGWDRDRIMSEVNDLGVPCYSGSCSEVYLEKAFQSSGLRPPRRLPNARALGEQSLMFLCHPTLEDKHVDETCDALERVMRLATQA